MKALVMGSCRVYTPCNAVRDVVNRYPWGMLHTLGQTLQAINIMKGKVDIPEKYFSEVFRLNRNQVIPNKIEDFKVDMSVYDKFIIEISNLPDSLIGENNNIYASSYCSLPHKVVEYDLEKLKSCLTDIYTGLESKSVLFILHNRFSVEDRYKIGYAISMVGSKNKNVKFLDVMNVIATCGVEKAMSDCNHYTALMTDKIRSEIVNFIYRDKN